MEINRSNFHPNFQAKLITGSDKVQEYVKKSFISKDTFDILDKFH